MKQYKYFSSVTIIILMASMVVLLNVGVVQYARIDNAYAENGYLDLSDKKMLADPPIILGGEWEVYENVLAHPGEVDFGSLRQSYTALPHTATLSASNAISYRLRLKLDESVSSLSFYFPFASYDTKLYFDGQLVNYYELHGMEHVSKINKFLFRIDVRGIDMHEIVIVSENNDRNIPMYGLVPYIGGTSSVGNYLVCMWGMEFFLMGMLMYIVLNGLLFMLLRPEHTMITRQTVFDTFIGARMITGSVLFYVLMDAVMRINIHTDTILKMQLVFMLLSSYASNRLISGLFNNDEIKPSVRRVCYLYIAESILIFLLPIAALAYMRYALLVTILINYCLLAPMVFKNGFRSKNRHLLLQAIKTVFISVVIFFDVMDITGLYFTQYGFYLYYCTFFLVHLFIKLIDNNTSYKVTDELTNRLEDIVEERTSQLLMANKKLEELSSRDALTGAYNRLYFERFMEDAISAYEQDPHEFHMCIMDIDYFKSINDKYGHDIGDEILKGIVVLVQGCLADKMELFRIGGEEFVIISHHMDWTGTLQQIEKLRNAIRKHTFINGIRLTSSFGVAAYSSELSYKQLFRLVDQCLYQAKNNGRNNIVTPDKLPKEACRTFPY